MTTPKSGVQLQTSVVQMSTKIIANIVFAIGELCFGLT